MAVGENVESDHQPVTVWITATEDGKRKGGGREGGEEWRRNGGNC